MFLKMVNAKKLSAKYSLFGFGKPDCEALLDIGFRQNGAKHCEASNVWMLSFNDQYCHYSTLLSGLWLAHTSRCKTLWGMNCTEFIRLCSILPLFLTSSWILVCTLIVVGLWLSRLQ